MWRPLIFLYHHFLPPHSLYLQVYFVLEELQGITSGTKERHIWRRPISIWTSVETSLPYTPALWIYSGCILLIYSLTWERTKFISHFFSCVHFQHHLGNLLFIEFRFQPLYTRIYRNFSLELDFYNHPLLLLPAVVFQADGQSASP